MKTTVRTGPNDPAPEAKPPSSPAGTSLTMAGLLMLGIALGTVMPWTGYSLAAAGLASLWVVAAVMGPRTGLMGRE